MDSYVLSRSKSDAFGHLGDWEMDLLLPAAEAEAVGTPDEHGRCSTTRWIGRTEDDEHEDRAS